jgi:hypothetical protein
VSTYKVRSSLKEEEHVRVKGGNLYVGKDVEVNVTVSCVCRHGWLFVCVFM